MKSTMGKPKCLPAMSSTKDATTRAPMSSGDVPNSESKCDQELPFSFRVNNELAKTGSDMPGGGKTAEEHKEAATMKEKRKTTTISRSVSSSNGTDGVLLNLHVPVPLSTPPHVAQETRLFTLEDLERR